MLKVDRVSGGYGKYRVIKDISFSVNKGEFFGILGPNGSGKTTLLKMISGILPCTQGSIQVSNKNIAQFSRKDLAKVLAVLPQLASHTFPYTVKETVALGRYAHHRGLFQTWSAEDEEILQEIMFQTNIVDFQNQALQELSGGEQQRVFLAQALVQKPAILLLDEPTNHLDLAHQKDLLDLLKRSTKQQALTVISIFHDLNLASLYCDRLLLLHQGEMKVLDTPDHVLTEPLIKEVYRTEVKKSPHPEVAKIQMHLLPQEDDTQVENVTIDCTLLDVQSNHIALRSPVPLRTLSSGVCGAGSGWNSNFVNRHVYKDYNCSDHVQDMSNYLIDNGFDPNWTVGMMTAVQLEDVAWTYWKKDTFSLFVVITAGVGNATDSARVSLDHLSDTYGTINTWIFVNGKLTEEAFIQSVMTATEAKTQALREWNIKDAKTGTPATGTSTDSILIATTQQGEQLTYAGTATALGKAIGESVFQVTKKAIKRSIKRGQSK